MIKRYIDFLNKYSHKEETLFENVKQAKDFLIKLETKRRKEQGIEDKLTDEEIRDLERDPYFLKIKDMLSQSPNLTYLFTKTFFKDLRPQWEDSEFEKDRCMEDLKNIYDSIKSKRDLWGLLPMPFDKYAALEPDEKDHRISIERLTDDWREVLSKINAKQYFINRLLPFQKIWFKDAPEEIMKRVNAIGDAFASFGKKGDGSIDEKEHKMINDDFFIKIRIEDGKRLEYIARFQTLGELLKGAEDYINTASKNSYKYVRDKIREANRRCGLENGVDIIWEDRGLMVVEVKSFSANVIVNNDTKHCIKDHLSQWNSYVNLEKFRRQYYIYNFNLPSTNNDSVIGVTVDKDGKPVYAHSKRDGNVLGSYLSNYIKSNKIPMDALGPYTKEEQKNILKRLDANKIMRNNGATYELLKDAIERGGDVNLDNGLPLKNAVSRGDFESVKLLIDAGAIIQKENNLFDKINNDVPPKDNLEIISILISNGVDIDQTSYRSIMNQLKGISIFSVVKVMLESGLDPNQMNGRLLRDGISRRDKEWVENLSKYNINFASRNYKVFLSLLQQGDGLEANKGEFDVKLIDIVLSKLKEKKDAILKDDEIRREVILDTLFETNYFVCVGSDEVKAKRIVMLLDKFVEYGSNSDHDFLLNVCKNKLSGINKKDDEYKYIMAIIKELK